VSENDRHDVLLGTSFFGKPDNAFAVYDAYWELGQRRFDTAWIYGFNFDPGCCERTLGQWLQSRGVADQAWVLAKGAHTPECYPDRVLGQLKESLERMGLERASLYMLHRDNEDVPAGEFVAAMAELVDANLLGAYGFSNWPLERVSEAVEFAQTHGLPSPQGISNQYSLIDMVQPLYPGVLGANSPQWRAWLPGSGMTLYPWASQGRGCFALDDPGVLRTDPQAVTWYSEENIARIVRARQLAEEKGTSATVISLAWTLAQEFSVCPIIGPRSVTEVHDSLSALALRLSPQERDWLETGP
jgi:aryl-alcohol dehydrogenase-like predicted oxidoreductase